MAEKNIHRLESIKDGDIIVINKHHYVYIDGQLKSIQEVFNALSSAVKNVSLAISSTIENISETLQIRK